MSGGGGRRPRVMLYSQDGLGLGHLRRSSAIAGALALALPGPAMLVAADSPAGPFFGTAPGQDQLKLPSIRKLAPGHWEPVSLALGFGEVLALRRELLRTAALRFKPDLLLVDHMPHGAMGELLPTLTALRRTGATSIVLGLRDILDAPEVIQPVWRREGAMDALERHYDRVLVYGRREVYDVAERYDLAPQVADRLRYTGYLCVPPGRARAAGFGAAGQAHAGRARILATVGGGADGYPLLDALLDALPAVHALRPCSALLVTGPFMAQADRQRLERRARGLPVRVRREVPDLPPLLAAADVAVTMAGYNTSVEVLRAGVPAVLVPRARPSAEQRTRAALFAERGWVSVMDPDALDPVALAAAVLDCLERGERGQGPAGAGRPGPDLDGLAVATAHLAALLHDQHEPAPAPAPAAQPAAAGHESA
jgi:predicted glycosyltransferase